MESTPRDTRGAPDPATPVNELPPTPDEGGPHDVPDDEVIEQTLPTASGTGRGGSASKRQPDAPEDRAGRDELHGGQGFSKKERP
jgi:hypothetical protein